MEYVTLYTEEVNTTASKKTDMWAVANHFDQTATVPRLGNLNFLNFILCLFVCLFVLLSLFQRCTWTKLAPGLPLTLRPRFGFGLRSTLELCKCSGFWFLALCTRSSFSGTTCLFASVGQDFTSSSHSPALTYRIGEALECGPLDVPVHVHPSLLVRFAAPVKVVEGLRCRKSSVQHLLQQVVVGL